MNCKTLHTKIIFFQEGSLPEKEMEEIRDHLEKCADCAVFASEMEKTLSVLDYDKLLEVNPFFYTRLKARLEKSTTEEVTI